MRVVVNRVVPCVFLSGYCIVHVVVASAVAPGRSPNADEIRLAFDMIHRVLVAPVTHVSPANGGLLHSPVKFAKFAKVAQKQVSDDAKKLFEGCLWSMIRSNSKEERVKRRI